MKPELMKELLLTPEELSQIKDREFIEGKWHYFNPWDIQRALLSAIEQKGYGLVKVDVKEKRNGT